MKYDKKREPPESMVGRKCGSTNFKQCGWCEHASGSHRYEYCISGKCQLQRSYDNEIKWDTQCLFTDASKSDIRALIDYKKRGIGNSRNSIKRNQNHIEILSELKKKADARPPLPGDRESEHFKIGKKVMVAIAEKKGDTRCWYEGEVKNGYRHQDGCVSFRLDDIGPQGANDTDFPFKDGYWGCGICVPTVMLKTEYIFFLNNLDAFAIWKRKVEVKDYNGDKIELPLLRKG